MDAYTHRFLDGFTPGARQRLVESLVVENHPDSTWLFREGDVADGLYLLLEGQVEILRTAGAGQKLLDVLEAGDYFGEVAVLDGFGRSTAARTRCSVTTAKIPRAVLLETLAAEPGAMTLGLFQHVIAHLRKANDLVVREVVQKEKLSLVGEMASSLMHDLRTPVAGIRLSADLINMTSPQGKVPGWCDGIRLQCDRLVGMAADLMEFSQGESRLTLDRTTTTAFLDQFKNLNDGYLAQTGIAINFEAEPAPIEIDSLRMQRVIQNLLMNAIEALHSIPNPHIVIRAWVKDSVFCLTVKDNGPGIPTAIQSRIFEPFVTHGKSKGTGLGMAIVRNIVVAHDGTITFETVANQGTTFLIRLPQK